MDYLQYSTGAGRAGGVVNYTAVKLALRCLLADTMICIIRLCGLPDRQHHNVYTANNRYRDPGSGFEEIQ